jgi:hypothetical protein
MAVWLTIWDSHLDTTNHLGDALIEDLQYGFHLGPTLRSHMAKRVFYLGLHQTLDPQYGCHLGSLRTSHMVSLVDHMGYSHFVRLQYGDQYGYYLGYCQMGISVW